MRIKAFMGLVPGEGRAERVASVPYDVVDFEEAKTLAEGNPDSLLKVSRAEIDLPEGINPYADEVYLQARLNFEGLQQSGALVREQQPCMYLYRQTMADHSQVGLVAVAHVDDYEDDVILKHEKTRRVKEDDRTRIASELGAHLGPVFLTYRGQDQIDEAVENIIVHGLPDTRFVAKDGICHETWRIPQGGDFARLFDAIPNSYVADGHHRSASASRVCSKRRSENPCHDGNEDYNWFLVVLFPADQLKILPYNRTVLDLNGLEQDEFIEKVSESFKLRLSDSSLVDQPGKAKMYIGGNWHELSWDCGNADPVSSLDVSVIQDRLLSPILGVEDPRTDSRIGFVGGIRGNGELESRVDSGSVAVAFALHQVTVDQLMNVADDGAIMPPKSTWFEPKLRSGLFIHTF